MRKSRSIEASPVGTIIAAICIIIYLAAMVQGAVRIYFSIQQHRITTEQEFSGVAAIATEAGEHSFMDERFIQAVNSALGNTRSIQAVIISGPDGEYSFERHSGRAIRMVNGSPRFINRFDISNYRHFRPLPIQGVRNVNIQASASSFDNAEFSRILKETILIILIGFSLAFFTLLMQLIFGKTRTSVIYIEEPVPESVANAKLVGESGQSEQADPKGLYSPRSNIGWEDYLSDRLNSELHRCASTEQDLTLFVMEFCSSINEYQYRQAAEEAASFFASRDLLFEKGKHGITMIYPGFGVEPSLAKAQQLHKRICDKVFFNHPDKSFCIGMSSRSGRLVTAQRIFMEANEALNKAKKDNETSIIAFKSDPEKYRKFIHKQA